MNAQGVDVIDPGQPSARRKEIRMVAAAALAWGIAHDGHDSPGGAGASERQGRRVDEKVTDEQYLGAPSR